MTTALDISKYIPHNATLIVGFSGGPDSVSLVKLLSDLQQSHNLRIIAAHLDHQWRENSGQDATWCANFCKQYPNITFISKTASQLNITIKPNGSKEETGRQLRRHFFAQCIEQYQADYIVLAHHQDDQIETFFIRLARGSSVAGLGAMRMQDNLYLRPLLHTTKQDILNYLAEHNVSYLTDPTNTDEVFLRNRIRKNLIPVLDSIDSRLQKNIISCIDHMQNTDDFLQLITKQKIDELATPRGLHLLSFLSLHEILQQRIILTLLIATGKPCTPSKALFNETLRFLRSGKHNQHQILTSVSIIKNKSHFLFKAL